MYHTLALYITNRCLGQAGQSEQKDITVYGAELLISSVVETIIVLVMGLVFGRLIETVLFLAFFCPLRSMSGGYHAPGYRSCTIIFSSIFLIMILVLQPMPLWLQIILLVISSITIWILAPVEDANKPLGEKRRKRLKKKSKYYLIAELVLYVAMYVIWGNRLWQSYIVCSFLAVGILLFTGNIRKEEST